MLEMIQPVARSGGREISPLDTLSSGTKLPSVPSAGTSQSAMLFAPHLPGLRVVHVWAASLDLPVSNLTRFKETLSKNELARAARFRFEKDRSRYIAAHGFLRKLLGAYLSIPACELEFEHSAKGKPILAGPAAGSRTQFNLAHSDHLALVAIARDAPVGIDIERIRLLPDAEELVTRFFSERERLRFKTLPEEQRNIAFFNLWTRKEAWLKATGEGISTFLDQVEVEFVPGEPARLDRVPQGFSDISSWTICDLALEPGFAAAMATPVSGALVQFQKFSHESTGAHE